MCRPYRCPVVAEYVARFIARTQQRYTQRGGMRPFGVSSILTGFSQDGQPQIYQVRAGAAAVDAVDHPRI